MGSTMRLPTFATLLLAAAVLPACRTSPPPAAVKMPEKAEASMTIAAPWTVTYMDGSANSYQLWQEKDGADAKLKYTPVTPNESSTGSYSGGDPVERPLDAAAVQTLWRHLRALEADKPNHAQARAKGTGLIRIKDSTHDNVEFLVNRVPTLLELDRFLVTIRTSR